MISGQVLVGIIENLAENHKIRKVIIDFIIKNRLAMDLLDQYEAQKEATNAQISGVDAP